MPQRSITSVQIICDYASARGINPEALLSATGLTSEQVQQGGQGEADLHIDEQQELQVINNLLQHIDNPYIAGMELGLCYQLTSYGLFGYALMASSTLRKAITFGQRYLALTYIFSDVVLIEDPQHGSTAGIEVRCAVPGEAGKLLACRDTWAILVIMRELFPQQMPVAEQPVLIELDMPEPEGFATSIQAQLLQQSGVAYRFNAGRYAFSGLTELLDQPLPKANAITARLCEQQCAQLLDQKQQPDRPQSGQQPAHSKGIITQQVRDQILKHGLTTNMEQVAAAMARTSRTLHRQLKAEGSSWRRVMDDVRMGLAEEYLKQPFSLEQVAERLGYSDTANFSHAFKRCNGVSPSVYRKQQQH